MALRVPLALALLVLARLADLGSTWLVAGGALRGERNLLHLAFGSGWAGLLLSSAAVVGLLVPAYLWAQRAEARLLPGGAALPFGRFWMRMWYGRDLPWWHSLWRLPPARRLGWLVAKYATWALSVGGFLAAAGNLVGASGPRGARVWGALIGSWESLLWMQVVAASVTFAVWMMAEHSRYLHARLRKASQASATCKPRKALAKA